MRGEACVETLKKLIIIPAYNERHNLASVILDIQRYAPTFDYIVINDCSTDDTRSLCETEGYRTVHLVQNLGIGGAVQTGYFFAKNTIMILPCNLTGMASMMHVI